MKKSINLSNFFSTRIFLILIGTILIILSIILWKYQEENNLQQLYLETNAKAVAFASDTEIRFNTIRRTLTRLANEGVPSETQDQWEMNKNNYIYLSPGLEKIVWVDQDYIIRLIAPIQENHMYLNQKPGEIFLRPTDISIIVPVYNGTELNGFILGIVDLELFVEPGIAEIGDGFVIKIDYEGDKVFDLNNREQPNEKFLVNRTINLHNTATLNLLLVPSEDHLSLETKNARVTLWVGFAFSILMIATIYFAQNANALSKLNVTRYRELLEEIDLIAVILDLNGEITFCNQYFLALTGWGYQNVLGRDWFAQFIPPPWGADKVNFLANAKEGIIETHYETLIQTRSGELRSLMSNATLLKNTKGIIVGIALLCVDITERKNAEEQSRLLLKQQIAANKLALSLGETNSLEKIYHIIYEQIKDLMDVQVFAISRYVEETALIHASYFVSEGNILDVKKLPPIPLEEPNKGTQSRVIRTGSALYIPDVSQEFAKSKTKYLVNSSNHEVTEGGPPEDEIVTQSALYMPMKDRGKVVGVMQVQSYLLDNYSKEDINLLSALANVASLAIQNARLFEESQQRVGQLGALRRIDLAISGKFGLQTSLHVVLNEVINLMEVDAVAILLFNKELKTLDFSVGKGFRTSALQYSSLKLGEGYAGQVAMEKRIIHIQDLSRAETGLSKSIPFEKEKFSSYVGAPLIAENQIIGVLEIFNRSPLDPNPEWFEFLYTLATQAAIAIDSATLFINLEQANMDLTEAYRLTLEGWAKALELKDLETEGHSKRVVNLSIQIANEFGVKNEELEHIRRGALLHDIGKMGIPDKILEKPGPLNEDEWEIMRKHPVFAYEWLLPIPYLKKALDIPYCHHEKWDGTGYPRGLKGKDIPLSARIFSVVDVWDALISDRPYRNAWPKDKTISYIKEQSGVQFDPEIVDVFLRIIESNP